MTDPRTGSRWIIGEKFNEVYPHLGSTSNLWERKYKKPCQHSQYPFHDGKFEDFEPIFNSLIRKKIDDGYSEEFAAEFIPTAERLSKEADAAKGAGDTQKAIELYLRSSAVYRIARFPYISNAVKREAYEAQKKTYLKAAELFELPIRDIHIPHTAAAVSDEGDSIPIFVRVPKGASADNPCPVVVLIGGLDRYRTDSTARSDEFAERGWASIFIDIPGTADSPAERKDPKGGDRLWTSLLDWIEQERMYDMRRVVMYGVSAGGYSAVRVAHTHAERLAGALAQGAGTHHHFSRAWLEQVSYHEHAWDPLPALVQKYGYESREELLEHAQKDWSLIELGIADMPSCRLLLVNGTHDGLMPVEDSTLMMEYGSPKEARYITNALHMGFPLANSIITPWIQSVIGTWEAGRAEPH